MKEELEIVNIRKYKTNTKTKRFYDLETEKNHNYFGNGILVHNSGTAFRDDGNDMMITATTGYKIFDLSSKVLIKQGWLVKPQISFYKEYMDVADIKQFKGEAKEGLINETPNYANYYNKFISTNKFRNNIIREIVEDNPNKKILILTKLIDHGQILKELIPNSEHLYGDTNKQVREQLFKDFSEGNLNVLISTISIFSEGIDLPILSVVINASANKGKVKSIQVLGRVLRKMEGKSNAQYIDFMDETKFFRLASFARKRAFMKEGHDVGVKRWKK